MRAEHFDAALGEFRRRVPFQPFTVTLVTGERFEVDRPDAMVNRDGVAMYLKPGGIPVIFDHEGVVQFMGDLMEWPDE